MKKISIIAFACIMMVTLGISAFASDGEITETTQTKSTYRWQQIEQRQAQCEEEAEKLGMTLEEYRAENRDFSGCGKGQMRGAGKAGRNCIYS